MEVKEIVKTNNRKKYKKSLTKNKQLSKIRLWTS